MPKTSSVELDPKFWHKACNGAVCQLCDSFDEAGLRQHDLQTLASGANPAQARATKWTRTHYHCTISGCMFRSNDRKSCAQHSRNKHGSHAAPGPAAAGCAATTPGGGSPVSAASSSVSKRSRTLLHSLLKPVFDTWSLFAGGLFEKLASPGSGGARVQRTVPAALDLSLSSPACAASVATKHLSGPQKRKRVPESDSKAQTTLPVAASRVWTGALDACRGFASSVMSRIAAHGSTRQHGSRLRKKERQIQEAAPLASELMQAAVFGGKMPAMTGASNCVTSPIRHRPQASIAERLQPSDPVSIAGTHLYALGCSTAFPSNLCGGALLRDCHASVQRVLHGQLNAEHRAPADEQFAELVLEDDTRSAYAIIIAPKDAAGRLRPEQMNLLKQPGHVGVRWLLGPDDVEVSRGVRRQGTQVDGQPRYALSCDYYDVMPLSCVRRVGSCLLEPDAAASMSMGYPLYRVLEHDASQPIRGGEKLVQGAFSIMCRVMSSAPIETLMTAEDVAGADREDVQVDSNAIRMFQSVLEAMLPRAYLLELVHPVTGQPILPPVCGCHGSRPSAAGAADGGWWKNGTRAASTLICESEVCSVVPQTYKCSSCGRVMVCGSVDFFKESSAWPMGRYRLSVPHIVPWQGLRVTEDAALGIWRKYVNMEAPRVAPLRAALREDLCMSHVRKLAALQPELSAAVQVLRKSGLSEMCIQNSAAAAAASTMDIICGCVNSVLGRSTLDDLLQLMYERCMQPQIGLAMEACGPDTAILRADCTFSLAKHPVVAETIDGITRRYTVATTAVTVAGTSGTLLMPPMLAGNESAVTLASALGIVCGIRRRWMIGRHCVTASVTAPAAVAVDNVAAMKPSVEGILEAHFHTSSATAIVQDVYHAIARVTDKIPSRYVQPDAPTFKRAVFDTYMWITTAPCEDEWLPKHEVLLEQVAFVRDNPQIIADAQHAARAWLRSGQLKSGSSRDAVVKALVGAGWVLEPALLGAQHAQIARCAPVPLFGLPVVAQRSSPLMLLAQLAAAAGLVHHRGGSQQWVSKLEGVDIPILPLNHGPRSRGTARAELLTLHRAFHEQWRAPCGSGSAVLPDLRDAVGSLLDKAPAAMKALRAAAHSDAVLDGLMASQQLYSGPSGTGPNEAAHSRYNAVMADVSTMSVPIFRRLMAIVWLKHVATAYFMGTTSEQRVEAGTAIRSVACRGAAAQLLHYMLYHSSNTTHCLSSGPLFDALSVVGKPRKYTAADARREGLTLSQVHAASVTASQRREIEAALDKLAEMPELPVSRPFLLSWVARAVPISVSESQVLAVARARGAAGAFSECPAEE